MYEINQFDVQNLVPGYRAAAGMSCMASSGEVLQRQCLAHASASDHASGTLIMHALAARLARCDAER